MTRASIAQLRRLIRTLNYVVSTHAADELDDDNLTILDFENIVLTKQIIERQRDRATRDIKCVIQGSTREGAAAQAVTRVNRSGRLVVITVYRC